MYYYEKYYLELCVFLSDGGKFDPDPNGDLKNQIIALSKDYRLTLTDLMHAARNAAKKGISKKNLIKFLKLDLAEFSYEHLETVKAQRGVKCAAEIAEYKDEIGRGSL